MEPTRAVLHDTVTLIDKVTDVDLRLPTPCAGWDLAMLLGHMTAQHHGFAAAARGSGGDLAVWAQAPAGADAADRYREAVADVLAAFSVGDVFERPFHLAEFDATVPGRMAVGMHLVDYVVHGWDVAHTLGAGFRPGAEAVTAALEVARSVPDGADRLAPGAPFAPAHPVPVDADPLTEILLLLGRDPSRRPG
ncbi:hypothetical protein MB27_42495 [Actinoplanes utahensis]|uniref:Mycothiol-dependent maleylpyruvate isomerase metal-binding domain-containing protein n=1 Tax=Actinoplanes utahensis TaxID=1869 RepID=A0A0A6U9I0_ACTUT|nr:hypothetical protein MB27_42495 [Actinoplanes utahensis]